MIGRIGNALALFAGLDPMARKELYGVSRRWQTYAGRTFYVGILAIVLAVMWHDFSRYGTVGYSRVASFGRELFFGFSVAQAILVALAAMGTASDMVSKEVRHGTLGLLTITPLTSWQIAWGKWKAVMTNVTMLILAGLPILGVGIYLGGATAMELLGVFAITVTSGAMCAALAILFSSLARGAATPLVASILFVAAYCFLPILAAVLISPRSPGPPALLLYLGYLHPAYTLIFMILANEMPGGFYISEYAWVSCSATMILSTFVLLGLASWRLSRIRAREHRKPLMRRFFEWMDGLFDRGPFGVALWRARTEVWDANPFLWKEMHFRLTGRLRWYIRIVVAALVLVSVLAILVMDDLAWSRSLPAWAYGTMMVLFFLQCVSAGGTAFTREKEERKWSILMTTPMRPGQILTAKLGGAVAGTLTSVVILALIVVAAAFVRSTSPLNFVPLLASTLLYGAYILSAGLFFSLALSTTRKSYMATLFAALFFLVIFPIGVSLLMMLAPHGSREVTTFVWDINPFRMLGCFWEGGYYYGYSRGSYGEYWEYLAMALFVFGSLSLALVAATRANFDGLARRNV